jgi:hypothetical protein
MSRAPNGDTIGSWLLVKLVNCRYDIKKKVFQLAVKKTLFLCKERNL